MATVYVGSASIDENGRAHGGKAGNQSGRELKRQVWYRHSKGWRAFRAKDAAAAERIALAMERAIANRHIGYDQYQRNTLYAAAKVWDFDVARVDVDCETDCSALVRVCCAYAGILGLTPEFRTYNEPEQLLATGAFEELVGSRYTDQSACLCRGDILVTRTSGHTVVVLSDGDRAEKRSGGSGAPAPAQPAMLRYGAAGEDVRGMQRALERLGYDLGRWGVDGDFGPDTDAALRRFQRDHALTPDGEYGPLTRAAMAAALEALPGAGVVRFSGDCYIRSQPSTAGAILGVAKRDSELPYGGRTAENGWLALRYGSGPAWVSGKYGRLVN